MAKQNRRKRKTSLPSASSPTPSPAQGTSQTSKRATRKEAAQAAATKRRQLRLLGFGLGIAALLAALLIFINRPTTSEHRIDLTGIQVTNSATVQNRGEFSPSIDDGSLDFATGITLGDPDAPVTFHIFSDFQCYYCSIFHTETLPQIVDDFVRDGQVKIVFHDFPRLGSDQSIADPNDLTIELGDENNESSLAAQAAMCAAEQDMYPEMSTELFSNFSGNQSGAFSRNNINHYADNLGLDLDPFNACMDSGRYIPALAESVTQGQANGIVATPMFIIDNGNDDPNVIQNTAEGYTLLKRQIELSIQTAP